MARPQLNITPEMIKHAQELRAKGCTEEEVAKGIGISYSAFHRHKGKFKQALKKGEDIFSNTKLNDVENSLLKRALGYEYIETKEETGTTETGSYIKNTKTKKQIIPDVTAQIFVLANRKPDKWQSINKAKVDIETIPQDINITFGN